MTTESLFDRRKSDWPETQVRRNPRPTEVSGAERGLPASGSHRRLALEYITARDEGGATSDEIPRYLELDYGKYVPPNQVASRIGELVKEGWIEDSGKTRTTRRGSSAIVWVYKHRSDS